MRDNIRQFLQLAVETFDLPSPVVEVGALQVEAQEQYADMRPLFGERLYLGGDMRPGQGVDCLIDAHRLPFRDKTVGTLLLLDTLEHVHSPLTAVEEACRTLAEGGVVMLASVMNFPIHSYPSDFWRFTPAAFDYLLEPLPVRAVLSQGDTEFPHTVVGLGMRAAPDSEAALAFQGQLRQIMSAWPEQTYGGPLLAHEPDAIVLEQRDDGRLLPELERGRAVSQSFVCPADRLQRIDVKLSSLGRANFSHLLFRLATDAGDEVAAYRVYAPHVVDKGWTFFPLPLQDASAGRRYVLTIDSPDATPGQGIAAFASVETAYREGELLVDGQPADGTLCFQLHCRTEGSGAAPRLEAVDRRADVGPASGPVADVTALMRRAEERSWEQVRHLASVSEAGIDAVRAELLALQQRQQELERLQQQALEQSTEAAAIVRSLKRNPLYRLWRRLFS
ncbi:MAG: methyltransferase domain-containing protein [Dehalococcoidia bacterium]